MAALNPNKRSAEAIEADIPVGIGACVSCGVAVGSEEAKAGCVHRGRYHRELRDCSARCAWGLAGKGALGMTHWSCCFEMDEAQLVCGKASHTFVKPSSTAPSTAPSATTTSTSTARARTRSTAASGLFGVSDCPRYIVNLDAPADERWAHVMHDFRDKLPEVMELVTDILGGGAGEALVTNFLSVLTAAGRVHYGAELRGIATATGVPLGKVVGLQLAYEAFAACTGIVVESSTGGGVPLHMRTMDWEMDVLSALTIEVDFVRGGTTLFSATTWAGYVGVLTGVRGGGYSVSVNYRRTEAGSNDMARGIATNFALRGLVGRHWPVSFLVRTVLEEDGDFNTALSSLVLSELMAPTYLVIAGAAPGEGAVVTRDREGGWENNDVRLLPAMTPPGGGDGSEERPPWLIQANMDCFRDGLGIGPLKHTGAGTEAGAAEAEGEVVGIDEENDWQDICDSRYRRHFVNAALMALANQGQQGGAAEEGQGGTSGGLGSATGVPVSEEDLWLLMSTPPAKAHDTVYTCFMCPATGRLVTRVVCSNAMVRAGKKRFGTIARASYEMAGAGAGAGAGGATRQ
mmetsp:Transcript_34153/g.78904  ORF Transcript_34153/g.78904 Transcript_34153/m.78904 type:complete len:574 (+) Transcript_34153:132-1853(+)